jgi:hypothetical protein
LQVILLSNPNDALVLSEFHVFVRQQIDVFTATEADITRILRNQHPARNIQFNDMKLEYDASIAVTYPHVIVVKRVRYYLSGIARGYYSVSDMKVRSHCTL